MIKTKSEIVQFRIKTADKLKLQAAANQEEVTVSEFLRGVIQQKCRRIKLTNPSIY